MKTLFLTVIALGMFLSFSNIQNAEARTYFSFNLGFAGPAYVVPRSYYVEPYYYYVPQRPVYVVPQQQYYYYPSYGYYYPSYGYYYY